MDNNVACFISIMDVAKLFNPPLSRTSLWKWRKNGTLKLTQYKIGSRVYYKKEEVLKEIEKMKINKNHEEIK